MFITIFLRSNFRKPSSNDERRRARPVAEDNPSTRQAKINRDAYVNRAKNAA